MRFGLLFILVAFIGSMSASPGPQLSEPTGSLYTVDELHSLLDFTARHIGFGRVRGTFKSWRAAAFVDTENLENSTFSAVIEVGSIDTGAEGRDGLLANEFFDGDNHPVILFESNGFTQVGDRYEMTGMLTMRDVTKEVLIPVDVIAVNEKDQWQHDRIVLEGSLTVNRKDYNLVYDNDFWDSIVADEIQIDISFGARRYNALNTIFPWRSGSTDTILRNVTAAEGFDAARSRVLELWQSAREETNFTYYRAGIAFAQEGLFDAAVGTFDLALQLEREAGNTEDIPDYLAYKGQVLMMAGRMEDARTSLEEALELDANHPVARELKRHLGD